MSRLEKFWDRQSKKYDRQVGRFDETYAKIVAATRRHLNAGDVVLDFACGTGTLTMEIAGNVKEIHAFDISSGMIDEARRKVAERGIRNIDYARSTIFDERYAGESFDVVLAFNILHLLEDTQKAMQRVHELLKPRGLFISSTACLGERWSFLGIVLRLLGNTRVFPYARMLKFSELETLVAGGGFEIVETEDLRHRPPNYFIVAKKV